MNLIFLLILLIIIIYVYTSYETFEPVSSNQYTNYEQQYKSNADISKPLYYSQLDYTKVPKMNCCLVEKKYLSSPNNLHEGDFKYIFTKKSDSECDTANYNINSNTQLIIEGDNNWSNNFCTTNSQVIGSCRNINKECIDFVDKSFCKKYRMKWTNKTCHNPLEFTWIDPIKRNLPERPKNDRTFKMF